MDFLHRKLEKATQEGLFRTLISFPENAVDFASNDYLGMVKNKLSDVGEKNNLGSTGSRLISGNTKEMEDLEKYIARFHNTSAALIFNSGYDANVGLIPALTHRGDTIIYDVLCHSSIRDGIRLSLAKAYSFLHNNMEDLEKKLRNADGTIFIIVESVYSMDGDMTPLKKIVQLSLQYNARIIVDEAHTTGVIGKNGVGLVQHLGLESDIFARVVTFGKALGMFGAAVLGSATLRTYLINFCRTFIYTTALPSSVIHSIVRAYEIFPTLEKERKRLQSLIRYFQSLSFPFEKIPSPTPIQGIMIRDNKKALKVSEYLRSKNFFIIPIRSPTVPKGTERLRIVLHAFNSERELTELANALCAVSDL